MGVAATGAMLVQQEVDPVKEKMRKEDEEQKKKVVSVLSLLPVVS